MKSQVKSSMEVEEQTLKQILSKDNTDKIDSRKICQSTSHTQSRVMQANRIEVLSPCHSPVRNTGAIKVPSNFEKTNLPFHGNQSKTTNLNEKSDK
jgi:hypothetical protein